MFKFIKQYADSMTDANIFPIISLFIFMVFFILLLVWVKKLGKDQVTEMENMPFEKDELTNSTF
ncbi:MAG: hypothetical protein U0V75_07460 [Ferruginibacter sp.]